MASNFTHELQVLNYGPQRPTEHKRLVSREYVLWPAWAYRVVAPRVRKRQLNLFQRAILGLCRAGENSSERLGQKLAIHSDLAAFIVGELTDLGCLDSYRYPTPKGLQVLADDSSEVQEMVAGYVFQDPWNGELWPRFVERLCDCELDYNKNGPPRLVLGTKGDRRQRRAFMVQPGNASVIVLPTAANIVAAISSYQKAWRKRVNLADPDEAYVDERSFQSSVYIERVSSVNEEPNAVYLMTYLYVASDDAGGTDWYACDPFGLGVSIKLRQRIEQVMQTMPPLYDVVDRLIGRGVHDGLEKQKQWIEHLKMQAELEVEKRLTINIRTNSAFEHIVTMERTRQEVMLLGRDCPESKLKHALRLCSETLEAMFGSIADRYPLGDVWKRVYVQRIDRRTGQRYLAQQQDKQLLQTIYHSAAIAVGFEEPLPESLLFIRPGQIRSVVEHGEEAHWRLRPLVAAIILAAQLAPDHPLRKAARWNPRLLQDVDYIAQQGGIAGHARKNKSAVTLDELARTIELTYSVISNLLDSESPDFRNLNGERR